MSHFCLLREPESYAPQNQDLTRDKAARKYWLDLYVSQFEQTLGCARENYGRAATKRIEAARGRFQTTIKTLRKKPDSLGGGRLNGIALCHMREDVLRQHNLSAPFTRIKDRENNSAHTRYGRLVRRVRAMEDTDRWLQLVRGVLAGNLFDLGTPLADPAANPSANFQEAVQGLKARPWLVDDFDLLQTDLKSAPPMKWSKAVLFIDNAGSDFILGVMPLARELALEGTQIVLAANERASLNDITADEAINVVEALATTDEDLAALIRANMFEVVSTGSGIPLLDLSDVSEELNEASAGADLVVLEGMGRAIESNYEAAFSVDALHLAVLKDPHVAAGLDGQPLDLVCKYTPVGS